MNSNTRYEKSEQRAARTSRSKASRVQGPRVDMLGRPGRLPAELLMSLSFTHPELGAFASMPEQEWAVARLRWLCDESQVRVVRHALAIDALALAERERWADGPAIRCGACGHNYETDAYALRLAHLATLEMLAPGSYKFHVDRATWFGCSIRSWESRHRARYEGIWNALYRKLDRAYLYIRSAQREE